MRYAVLHGPRSGRGRAAAVGKQVVTGLEGEGQQVRRLETGTLEAARAACVEAVDEGVDVLVVVGGDGAVSLAAGVLARRPGLTALGIVPCGSGNDTARSLGIPLRRPAAIRTLVRGGRRRIDLVHVPEADRHVVASVPAGLDALIAARASGLPRWLGPASYAVATVPELVRLAPMEYRLTVDGVLHECTALVVAVCNLPVYGGGMRIAPDADPTDGLLDVVVIEPVGPLAAASLLAGVFTARHLRHRAVRVLRGREVHVAGPDLMAHGDGEPLAPLPLTCQVVPRGLEVVVPRG